jgi:hypothetical protein
VADRLQARLTQVLVIGEGKRTVNQKEQWCYVLRIPKIDDGTEFHIVKFNIMVTTAPNMPFPGKDWGPRSRQNQRPASAVAAGVDPNHVVDHNAVRSVGEGADAIEELRRSGAKESKWTTTTSRHQKTPKSPRQWQMVVEKSPPCAPGGWRTSPTTKGSSTPTSQACPRIVLNRIVHLIA